ncbi:MAG: S1 RNA-binding domain-containing protein, partial [bacterium]|nr:S1 RNA-binding domain-containing protein [bacterium]
MKKNDSAVATLKEAADLVDSIPKENESKIEAEEKEKKESLMGKLLKDSGNPPSVGDLIEGTVLNIEKAKVFVDLPPYGTGIIYGREYINARDVIKKVSIGDKIAAKVVDVENE